MAATAAGLAAAPAAPSTQLVYANMLLAHVSPETAGEKERKRRHDVAVNGRVELLPARARASFGDLVPVLCAGLFRDHLCCFRPHAGSFAFVVPPFGVAQARKALLASGAQAKFATERWVQNHFKWVVWKLAAYERRFGVVCGGRALTPSGIIAQLRYRWATKRSLTACCG